MARLIESASAPQLPIVSGQLHARPTVGVASTPLVRGAAQSKASPLRTSSPSAHRSAHSGHAPSADAERPFTLSSYPRVQSDLYDKMLRPNPSTAPVQSATQELRTNGTEAFLKDEFTEAYEQFSMAIELEGDLTARAELYRLRGTTLIQLERFYETLQDAQRILDTDPTSLVGLSMKGEAYLQLQHWDDACAAFSAALAKQPPHSSNSNNNSNCLHHFLTASQHAKNARLPTSLYLSDRVPIFRLLLRPLFVPWPLDINLRVLQEDGWGLSDRLNFFAAFKEMPADPHLLLVKWEAEEDCLLLLDIKVDGRLEMISNCTQLPRKMLNRLFLRNLPSLLTEGDWQTLCSSWVQDTLVLTLFQKILTNTMELSKESASKQEREKEKARRAEELKWADLRNWLDQLGLSKLADVFIKEEIDLETLQYLEETDLDAMGISEVGPRRKIMAAKQSQQQYKQMAERVAQLEEEKRQLLEEGTEKDSNLTVLQQDNQECKKAVQQLRDDLEEQTERGDALTDQLYSPSSTRPLLCHCSLAFACHPPLLCHCPLAFVCHLPLLCHCPPCSSHVYPVPALLSIHAFIAQRQILLIGGAPLANAKKFNDVTTLQTHNVLKH